jgi:RNA polymerase sigma-70 factor (ECF subfamily)
MDHPLAPDDLHTLLREADAAARRVHRKLRLPPADLDDLRQDLLVDLLARLPSFDRERGSLGAFAGVVLRHESARIAEKVARRRQQTAGGALSLDAPVGAHDDAVLSDTLCEADGLGAWLGQPADAFHEVERRLDVERAVAAVEPRQGALCAELTERSVDQLAAAGHGARTSLYRRVRELRMTLAAQGLRPAWDVS